MSVITSSQAGDLSALGQLGGTPLAEARRATASSVEFRFWGHLNIAGAANRLRLLLGVVPHESDTHAHRGRITKQGSRLVRWAVIESVQTLPKTTTVGIIRDRVGARRGRNTGVVAASRRQLEYVFYALRDHHLRALDHPRVGATMARQQQHLRYRGFSFLVVIAQMPVSAAPVPVPTAYGGLNDTGLEVPAHVLLEESTGRDRGQDPA